ncbi:MAG: hypothetical protein JNJ40_09135 [Bacteroidia bacterium]|nr:hypothetical protein [Bacteroidia bacterium]
MSIQEIVDICKIFNKNGRQVIIEILPKDMIANKSVTFYHLLNENFNVPSLAISLSANGLSISNPERNYIGLELYFTISLV